MPDVSYTLTNFTGGEFSPRLAGRVDFSKYYNACEILENMIVLPHGGATRRPGTYFVAEVKDSSKAVRLIPFEFSTEQAYILEFGHEYMRVYKDNGQVQSGSSPYEIATPYQESELFELQYAQSADTMYISHLNHRIRKLTRTGHTSWTLSVVDFIDGPYLSEQTTTAITPSGTTGSITLTSTDAIFQDSGDVNRLIRIKCDDSNWYWLLITAVTSTTVVTATVKGDDLPNANPVTEYRLGYWSNGNGFPACVAFYEQRLWLASSYNYPQTFWGSMSADYENHTPGTDDADPVIYTIASDQVNVVQWLSPGKVMLAGTTGGEFVMKATGIDEPITPTNIQIKRETLHGSAWILPARVGHATLFLQRAGLKIRELIYNFDVDGYVAPDLTILAEHITEGGIVDMSYQQEPDSILWSVRADGVLLGMTYERAHEIVAWHRHITDGEFESVAVIPVSGRDQVWFVVKRNIDGNDVRYVEYMKPTDWGADQEDCYFVDCGLTYDSTPTSSISGADHLESEEVAVLRDGAVHPNETVESGSITLDKNGSVVHLGLPFTSKLKTMGLEPGAEGGTTQAKLKRISEATIRFYKSLGCKLGPDNDNLDIIPFGPDIMDEPPPLFTGKKKAPFPMSDELDAQIMVIQEQPLPMTILAISPDMEISSV